ncbi:MAG: NADPH-dependent oxidoreductase [Rhodospirillaceae bacterium]|nr:NADPH-dependent oxidoreductase [Rhodospirillaceae bacterium]
MTTISDLIEDRFGLATEAGKDMPDEGEIAGMLRHRSCRAFIADKPVPNDMLEIILAAAFSAPAKSDLQQSAVVIVDDPEKRRTIEALMPAMPWIADAPVFMVFCGDNRRIRRVCEMRGTEFANDHLDSFLNPSVDTGIVLGWFVRAAQAAGLGCCPISVVRNHIETISEVLELPDHVFPVAGMCLGWPVRPGYISLRLGPRIQVHRDRYDDTNLAEEIDAYDRRRDARYSIPEDKQRRRDTYGTAEFYGWSADKSRQVSLTEREQLAGFLRKKGFKLD